MRLLNFSFIIQLLLQFSSFHQLLETTMTSLSFTFQKSQTPWIKYCKYFYLTFANYCNQFYSFYAILLSYIYTRVMVNNYRVWQVIKKEGSIDDFHLICNISVVSTGFIWLYLWVYSSNKVLDAYYTIMAVSLVHFAVILLLELRKPLWKRSTRSIVRLVSNPRFRIDEKPILTFLKKDNTGMFIFTCLMIDSRVNYCKIGLLVYYAILNLVQTTTGSKSKRHPLIHAAYFGLGILENVVLVIFWYESLKLLQFNKAICYTLMYLLRLEESGSTNKPVKGLIEIVKVCYKKLNPNETPKQLPETAEIRTTSLGFDCYSIISDVK